MVCLELTINRSNPAAYSSNYIGKTINCLDGDGHARSSKEGETWLNLSDLTTDVEYPIYLETQTARCFQSFLRVKGSRSTSPNWTLYDDWFLHYYVRPLIRTRDIKGMIKSPSRFMRFRPDSIMVEYCIHDELT